MQDGRRTQRLSPAGLRRLPPPAPILSSLREIVRLSTEFERHLGRVLAVNATDLAAMEHLIESGPLTPSDIARRLHLSTAAATLVVDRLEASGHAERRPFEGDRRKVVVVPNMASTQRTADELLPVVRGVAALLTELTPEDSAAVERFLGDVVRVYRDALEAGER
ncbi:MarR family winged helix-turn-helix transcriptional regulator [Naasia aerilata]|uniref:MarR family transcriptional regulator n=1 Tax=Naasia aerilata TaxID=1162966 RepID=A0ABN6XJ81_9MICO|nr:MarR family transcriptional regulator [Naasia aerilata]BDZ44901.1 MarR family transcriptional regulator [Naasia aerilata]